MFNPVWVLTHWNVLSGMGQAAQPVPAYARELHRRASAEHDAWDLLPTIVAPTLVLHGGPDQVNPTANAYQLAERIPGAELHIVPRGRHMFFLEFRTEVNRLVTDFLVRHLLNH
jgi:pimeloyl-ACP methyl ester carboxylesterase